MSNATVQREMEDVVMKDASPEVSPMGAPRTMMFDAMDRSDPARDYVPQGAKKIVSTAGNTLPAVLPPRQRQLRAPWVSDRLPDQATRFSFSPKSKQQERPALVLPRARDIQTYRNPASFGTSGQGLLHRDGSATRGMSSTLRTTDVPAGNSAPFGTSRQDLLQHDGSANRNPAPFGISGHGLRRNGPSSTSRISGFKNWNPSQGRVLPGIDWGHNLAPRSQFGFGSAASSRDLQNPNSGRLPSLPHSYVGRTAPSMGFQRSHTSRDSSFSSFDTQKSTDDGEENSFDSVTSVSTTQSLLPNKRPVVGKATNLGSPTLVSITPSFQPRKRSVDDEMNNQELVTAPMDSGSGSITKYRRVSEERYNLEHGEGYNAQIQSLAQRTSFCSAPHPILQQDAAPIYPGSSTNTKNPETPTSNGRQTSQSTAMDSIPGCWPSTPVSTCPVPETGNAGGEMMSGVLLPSESENSQAPSIPQSTAPSSPNNKNIRNDENHKNHKNAENNQNIENNENIENPVKNEMERIHYTEGNQPQPSRWAGYYYTTLKSIQQVHALRRGVAQTVTNAFNGAWFVAGTITQRALAYLRNRRAHVRPASPRRSPANSPVRANIRALPLEQQQRLRANQWRRDRGCAVQEHYPFLELSFDSPQISPNPVPSIPHCDHAQPNEAEESTVTTNRKHPARRPMSANHQRFRQSKTPKRGILKVAKVSPELQRRLQLRTQGRDRERVRREYELQRVLSSGRLKSFNDLVAQAVSSQVNQTSTQAKPKHRVRFQDPLVTVHEFQPVLVPELAPHLSPSSQKLGPLNDEASKTETAKTEALASTEEEQKENIPPDLAVQQDSVIQRRPIDQRDSIIPRDVDQRNSTIQHDSTIQRDVDHHDSIIQRRPIGQRDSTIYRDFDPRGSTIQHDIDHHQSIIQRDSFAQRHPIGQLDSTTQYNSITQRNSMIQRDVVQPDSVDNREVVVETQPLAELTLHEEAIEHIPQSVGAAELVTEPVGDVAEPVEPSDEPEESWLDSWQFPFGRPVSAVSLFYPIPKPLPTGRTESIYAPAWRKMQEKEEPEKPAGRVRHEGPAVRPLSENWESRLEHAMRQPNSKKIATTLSGEPLTKKDLATCYTPMAWLNDEVINSYLALIIDYLRREADNAGRHDKPLYHAFNSFFFSNLRDKGYVSVRRWATRAKIGGEDLLKVKTVFIPVHNSAHWTLIVVNPVERTIEHFDSLGSLSHRHIEIVKTWLRGELGGRYVDREWTVLPSESPQQDNGSDCGVFLLSTAKAVAVNMQPLSYGAGDTRLLRQKIVAELMNGGLEGEFTPKGQML